MLRPAQAGVALQGRGRPAGRVEPGAGREGRLFSRETGAPHEAPALHRLRSEPQLGGPSRGRLLRTWDLPAGCAPDARPPPRTHLVFCEQPVPASVWCWGASRTLAGSCPAEPPRPCSEKGPPQPCGSPEPGTCGGWDSVSLGSHAGPHARGLSGPQSGREWEGSPLSVQSPEKTQPCPLTSHISPRRWDANKRMTRLCSGPQGRPGARRACRGSWLSVPRLLWLGVLLPGPGVPSACTRAGAAGAGTAAETPLCSAGCQGRAACSFLSNCPCRPL